MSVFCSIFSLIFLLWYLYRLFRQHLYIYSRTQ